ncbi:hypothetical protein [Paenibacillus sp. MDMC362]|uniref:hypothetical protein n=1 Tax=Paenibacillus sp. MDMC362 TaxID=2977365 RepID=UPI000DC5BD0A|nr:hypothetical protein [Paenibacillus sp. MDMC362]RAR38905.1 hypothetical protein DP091_30660 [Paenibacillus sp. MDMC362]
MQITIAGDCQMYIYFKDKSKHQHQGSLSDVRCKMLYDSSNNLVGINILSTRSDTGESIVFPEIGSIEFPMYNATITQDDDGIIIMFDQDAAVQKEVEDECILDLCAAGISGVEPMPFTHVGGKEIIKPFTIRDV